VLLNSHLQVLGRPKCDLLACFDLDCLSGGWIAPHASCALPDLQNTQPRNLDSLTFLEMLGDEADEIAEDVKELRERCRLG
jgi:hypothetical protein